MENSWVIIALAYALAIAFIAKIITKGKPKQLPPGPKPWPIIGNLNLLGPIPHQSLHHLSKKYGEIMLLKFGKFPVVVASSPEMAKQFLRTHGTVFASRPALSAGKYTSYNYSDLVWAPYGPYFHQARKVYLSEVFSSKRLEFFEQKRVEERRKLLSRLHALSGKPIMLRDHLARNSFAIIGKMVMRDEYFCKLEENSSGRLDELMELVDEWFFLNGVFNIGDWIPWVNFLDLQGYVKKMRALNKKLDMFFSDVIDDHLVGKAARKDDVTPKDLTDVLLQMADDPNLEIQLTRDCVKALVQNLLVGGTDTAAVTIEWAIQEILRQPRIMKKAKEELESVIGRNKWVEEKDLSQLPYIEAIIKESFRLHPPGTILAPHYAIDDCKVAGYDISKGTTVIINAWSIGRDPNSWDAPEEFLPERFMGEEIDILGSNFALLPFGSGRRRCPGYNLGLRIVRATLANLLHGFELKLANDITPQDVCLDEEYGLTTHPKEPLSIIMEPTLPSHLYGILSA